MKRALVIGGTGFLGIHIVDELLAQGWDVRVTKRKLSPTLLLGKRRIALVDASLEERSALRNAMRDCSAVFLAGAFYPKHSLDREGALQTGLVGIRNVCSAALEVEVPRLIYTSSVGTLASVANRSAMEDDIPTTIPTDSVYRAVKWSMERELEAFQRQGLNAVSILPGGCIGPMDARVGTGALLVGTVRNELPWWVDGTINLVDVADVARVHVHAVSAPAGARYCVAGHSVRVRWVLETLAKRFHARIPAEELGAEEARRRALEEEALAAKSRHQRAPVPREFADLVLSGQLVSNARVEQTFGVRMSSLEAAFDRAHAWYARFRYFDAPAVARV